MRVFAGQHCGICASDVCPINVDVERHLFGRRLTSVATSVKAGCALRWPPTSASAEHGVIGHCGGLRRRDPPCRHAGMPACRQGGRP
ncbi:hypothetical protein [Xanthomonas euroxanthea]|uniref:hypothetical protein n=1 Tax=Xanthomonas euroxanthea TaxID=2259622 RepID=UPI00142FAF46|nr:hypothetical protein [Xanthomonas euroxanthea]